MPGILRIGQWMIRMPPVKILQNNHIAAVDNVKISALSCQHPTFQAIKKTFNTSAAQLGLYRLNLTNIKRVAEIATWQIICNITSSIFKLATMPLPSKCFVC